MIAFPSLYSGALQLELFRDGNRGGTAYAHIMRPAAARLSPEQIRAVAYYFASLPPDRPSPFILPPLNEWSFAK